MAAVTLPSLLVPLARKQLQQRHFAALRAASTAARHFAPHQLSVVPLKQPQRWEKMLVEKMLVEKMLVERHSGRRRQRRPRPR